MTNDISKRRDIAIYKPNLKKTGSVAQFKLGGANDCMFLECTRQIGEMTGSNPYDWKNKIIVKLGTTDLCKMLAYFNLYQPASPLKLMHKLGTSNQLIELKWQEYNGHSSYYLSVSHKAGDAEANRVSIPIALDEVEYLVVGFRKALEIILDWDPD